METAKVTSIQDTGKKYNDLFKVRVVLDNGKKGTVNAKNFPPPYAVGDTVEIKECWDDGNLRKISKVSEGFAPTGGSTTSAPARKEYDPLPGFIATNLALAIQEVQADNGSGAYSKEQVANKVLELHQLHADLVVSVREKLNNGSQLLT